MITNCYKMALGLNFSLLICLSFTVLPVNSMSVYQTLYFGWFQLQIAARESLRAFLLFVYYLCVAPVGAYQLFNQDQDKIKIRYILPHCHSLTA